MKINGQTWYQWARQMFEFEYCHECGKGVRGHLPCIVFGNWFALCKIGANSEETDIERERRTR